VATKIRELITELKNQGYSEENAETQVASELAEQARRKSKVKEKLFKWGKSFTGVTAKAYDETEAAREVVKRATTYSYTSSKNFTEVVGGNLQKLEELLRKRKWKEADKETQKIIHQLSREELPEGSQYRYTLFVNYFSDEHIRVLPEKDLNLINNLWLKHSNGRFGFSVQKRIWKSLGGRPYPHYNTEIAQNFGDIVGWRKEGDWVYYSDINYSLTAPPGHLPIIVMLNSDTSQRCSIHQSIFGVFVGRQYNARG